MSEPKRKPAQPKPPMITLRAGKLSATVPVDVLLRLAPAARQASEGFARIRATIERDCARHGCTDACPPSHIDTPNG